MVMRTKTKTRIVKLMKMYSAKVEKSSSALTLITNTIMRQHHSTMVLLPTDSTSSLCSMALINSWPWSTRCSVWFTISAPQALSWQSNLRSKFAKVCAYSRNRTAKFCINQSPKYHHQNSSHSNLQWQGRSDIKLSQIALYSKTLQHLSIFKTRIKTKCVRYRTHSGLYRSSLGLKKSEKAFGKVSHKIFVGQTKLMVVPIFSCQLSKKSSTIQKTHLT